MTAPFSTWSLYKAYLRFFGLMVRWRSWSAWSRPSGVQDPAGLPDPLPVLLALAVVIALALAYFVVATVIAFAYQATVRLTLWRLSSIR